MSDLDLMDSTFSSFSKIFNKNPSTEVRVACSIGHRLFEGLRFDCVLLPVKDSNLRKIFTWASPDLFLAEFSSLNGFEDIEKNTSTDSQRLYIAECTKLASEYNIPSVCWITSSIKENELEDDLIKNYLGFDLVCYADTKLVNHLRSFGVKAEVLLPCVQPAIYNPFLLHNEPNVGVDVLHEADADSVDDDKNAELKMAIKKYGFSFKSLNGFDNPAGPIKFQTLKTESCDRIKSRLKRLDCLKSAKAYVTSSESNIDLIKLQWNTLEAIACRIAVVHHGVIDSNDLRNEIIVQCADDKEFYMEFLRYKLDDLYRERLAHKSWREVNLRHTFAHRLKRMCDLLEVNNQWVEYPLISVVTPTFRPELIEQAIRSFRKINYPNKELVLVLNMDNIPDIECSEDILMKIVHVPSDRFAGAAMNYGGMIAAGKYIFRADDDDIYGENYFIDMVLAARAVNVNTFGKHPVALKFDEDNFAYIKKDKISYRLIPSKTLRSGQYWLAGNTITATKDSIMNNPYLDCFYGSADTARNLSLNSNYILGEEYIAVMDNFNAVACRRNDLGSHTWRDSKDDLLIAREKMDFLEDMFV